MKKYRQPRSNEFAPTVRVTLVQGERLAAETARLAEVGTAEKDAASAAVEEQQKLLAPDIKAAHDAQDVLYVWLKDNADALNLLRSIDTNAVRGRYHDGDGRFEQARSAAAARVAEVFSNVDQARNNLAQIESRVASLTSASIAPRVFPRDDRFPTVFPRDGWYAAGPAHIRSTVVRETRRVAHLQTALDSARAAIAVLFDAVNMKEKLAGREGPKKSEATLRDPDEMARAAAANPNVPLQDTYESIGDPRTPLFTLDQED